MSSVQGGFVAGRGTDVSPALWPIFGVLGETRNARIDFAGIGEMCDFATLGARNDVAVPWIKQIRGGSPPRCAVSPRRAFS